MTNSTPHGQVPEALETPSPDQLRAIARVARNSAGSASDDCGPLAYVLHGWRAAVTAMRTQQPAPATQQEPALFVSAKQLADLADPSHATAGSYLPARKTRAGRFTVALYTAPQPSPTAQADSQPAQVLDYPPLPTRRRAFLCTKCGGRECEPGTLTENHPTCKCGYLGFAGDLDFTAEEMRAYADETYALRIGAKHA